MVSDSVVVHRVASVKKTTRNRENEDQEQEQEAIAERNDCLTSSHQVVTSMLADLATSSSHRWTVRVVAVDRRRRESVDTSNRSSVDVIHQQRQQLRLIWISSYLVLVPVS